jgi:hypothetical protein
VGAGRFSRDRLGQPQTSVRITSSLASLWCSSAHLCSSPTGLPSDPPAPSLTALPTHVSSPLPPRACIGSPSATKINMDGGEHKAESSSQHRACLLAPDPNGPRPDEPKWVGVADEGRAGAARKVLGRCNHLHRQACMGARSANSTRRVRVTVAHRATKTVASLERLEG